MTSLAITIAYLKHHIYRSLLQLSLIALGVSLITVILIVGNKVTHRLQKDAKRIDLVVGGKGSRLQLVMSSVYHMDIPTGNIPLSEAVKIKRHPLVLEAVPISLGDSYRGMRIVGTDERFFHIYPMRVHLGKTQLGAYRAVVGAEAAKLANLKLGDTFYGSHGISTDTGQAGHVHEEGRYQVIGVLEKAGNAVDRLILTDLETMWLAHEEEGYSKNNSSPKSKWYSIPTQAMEGKEITTLLIQYKNARAHHILPKKFSAISGLQAASPAIEITRLFKVFGLGENAILGLGGILLTMAILSLFTGLLNGLNERGQDLALMRSLGASTQQVFFQIILEGLIMSLGGLLLGLFLGHGLVHMLGHSFWQGSNLGLHFFSFSVAEAYLFVGMVLLGIVASLIPAVRVYKIDVIRLLERG